MTIGPRTYTGCATTSKNVLRVLALYDTSASGATDRVVLCSIHGYHAVDALKPVPVDSQWMISPAVMPEGLASRGTATAPSNTLNSVFQSPLEVY